MGKYVEQHLHDDEYIIETLKFSRLNLGIMWVLSVLFFGVTVSAIFVVPMLLGDINDLMRYVCAAGVVVVNFLATCWIWKGLKQYRQDTINLTGGVGNEPEISPKNPRKFRKDCIQFETLTNKIIKRVKKGKKVKKLKKKLAKLKKKIEKTKNKKILTWRWGIFFVLIFPVAGLFILPTLSLSFTFPSIFATIFEVCIVAFGFILCVIPSVCATIIHNCQEVVITNKRVAIKQGVFNVRCQDIPLDKIIDSDVIALFRDRVLCRQQLAITSETRPYRIKLYERNAYEFKNALMAQIEEQQESRFARQASWTAQALAKNTDQMQMQAGYGTYKSNQNAIGYREDAAFEYED